MRKVLLSILFLCVLVFSLGQSPVVEASPQKKVGVMFSETSERYAKIERPGGKHNGKSVDAKVLYSSTRDKQLKMFHMLEQQGFSPIKITEKDLAKRDYLASFDTIVFPYTVQMNHGQRQAVKEYIRDGGGAIFAFQTGRNDSSVFPAPNQLDLTPLIYRTASWIWEWDNLSEVFQSGFVNDVVLKNYKIGSTGSHSIIKNAEQELGRKIQMTNTRSAGDWIEVILPYSGYVVPLLQYDSFSSSSSPQHTPKNTGAAYAMEYGKGRVVYAGFKMYDHLQVDVEANWEDKTRGLAYDGTTGNEDARAFLKHSVRWTFGNVNKVREQAYSVDMKFTDLRGYLRASDYSIYGTVHVENNGVTPTRGTMLVEFQDRNGKTLRSYERYKPGYTPKNARSSGPQLADESKLQEKFHLQLPKNLAHGTYKLRVTFKEGLNGNGYAIKSTVKDVVVGRGNAQFKEPSYFKDVAANNSGRVAIHNLANLQVINGYSDGTFRPARHVTRIQAAEMILRATKAKVQTGLPLAATDLKRGDYGYDSIATAVQKGILSIDNGQARPHAPISRGEMAQALKNGFQLSAYSEENLKDVPASHRYSKDIQTIYALGVTTGFEDGTFRPSTTVSRQHFSVFVNRSLTAVQK